MMRFLILPALTLAIFTAGCRDEAVSGITIRETTFRSSPVVIEDFTVGNLDLVRGAPLVVAGAADITTGPRGGGPSVYSGFKDARVDVEIAWVELLTDRAYAASLAIDAQDLPRTSTAELVVVIGPNGLLIIADDETNPVSHGEVAALCATRVPVRDTAWRLRDPLSRAGLTEALTDTYPPVPADTRCPDPGQ